MNLIQSLKAIASNWYKDVFKVVFSKRNVRIFMNAFFEMLFYWFACSVLSIFVLATFINPQALLDFLNKLFN